MFQLIILDLSVCLFSKSVTGAKPRQPNAWASKATHKVNREDKQTDRSSQPNDKESIMADVKKLAEELTKLTVLEVNDLKTVLKDEYGIEPAAAAVAVAGPAAEAGP